MNIRTYLNSVDVITKKEYSNLRKNFSEKDILLYLQTVINNTDDMSYQSQIKLWNKYGYCFARLEIYPFFDKIVSKFQASSKKKDSEIDTSYQLTCFDEVKYSFKLLNKNYISFMDKLGNIDIIDVINSFKSDISRNKAISLFISFYYSLHGLSNVDRKNLEYLEKLKIYDNNNNNNIYDDDLLDEVTMYINYRIARDNLIFYNVGLVKVVANSYLQNYNFSFEDYYQEWCYGLFSACDHYDIRYMAKFSNYAIRWINNHILYMYKVYHGSIRLPIGVISNYNKISRIDEEYYKMNGRHASREELAKAAGITVHNVDYAYENIARTTCSSLQTHVASSDKRDPLVMEDCIGDKTKSIENDVISDYNFNSLYEIVKGILTDKELFVFKSYLGLDGDEALKYREIGKKMNLTRQRVQQIYKKALDKLNSSSKVKKFNPNL